VVAELALHFRNAPLPGALTVLKHKVNIIMKGNFCRPPRYRKKGFLQLLNNGRDPTPISWHNFSPLLWSSWKRSLLFSRRDIYLWMRVVCFALSPKPQCFMLHSWYFWKLLMSRGALAWFETVCTYSVEVIDYWEKTVCDNFYTAENNI
jgi:hypothetical protein